MEDVNTKNLDDYLDSITNDGFSTEPTNCSVKANLLMDGDDEIAANTFSIRDRCWLCQRARKDDFDEEGSENGDGDCLSKSKDGALHEFLPWLCKTCEKTIEEDEQKAEPGTALPPSLAELDSNSFDSFGGSGCTCETCSKARDNELEQVNLMGQLERCWKTVKSFLSNMYHVDTPLLSIDDESTVDIDQVKELVAMLCTQDPDQLYQRLETLVREVVIEMKVKLLKKLTVDQKAIHRAHQFLSLLLNEYSLLCEASEQASALLLIFENQYLRQFNLTWSLHDRHLFHSVIYSDPVVQNCLPKVIGHIRSTLSSTEDSELLVQYNKTLEDYEKLNDEMSMVGAVWKDCKRLIERYNEQQAALRLKQKMFKEDWAFFKAQRRLLEQAVPQSRSASSRCCFDVQFNDLMKNILQGNKPDGDCRCSLCNQVRCPCDECNISHMITCGLISPEVSEELAATHQCRYQQRKQHEQLLSTMPSKSETTGGGSQPSPSPLPPPLSFSYDPMRFLGNVKPPSMPSSGSTSRSESPLLMDHYRFMLPFGDNFELPDDIGSDEETMDCFSRHRSPHKPVSNEKQSSGGQNVLTTEVTDDGDSSVLKEVRPSSLVARMMMASVDLSADKSTCTCPHCMLNNGTLCMFDHARRNLAESKPTPAVDRLQLSQFGMARRLLNPQLYELQDEDVDDADVAKSCVTTSNDESIMCNRELDMADLPGGNGIRSEESVSEEQQRNRDIDSSFKTSSVPANWCEVCDDNQRVCQHHTLLENSADDRNGEAVLSLVSPVVCDRDQFEANIVSIIQTVRGAADGVSKTDSSPIPGTFKTVVNGSGEAQPAASVSKSDSRSASQVDSSPQACGTVPKTETRAVSELSHVESCIAATPSAGRLLPNKLHSPATTVPVSCASLPPPTSFKSVPPVKLNSSPATTSSCKHPTAPANVPPCSANGPSERCASESSGHPKCTSLHTSGTSQCKNATQQTNQCCGGKQQVDASDASGCSGDGVSRTGSGQKEGGKFCECWHCEFFGHSLPATLPASRNYAEIRDRLRQRLQKKKANKTQCVANNGVVAGPPPVTSSPLGSPRSGDVLSEKELEEIIRFINGVDSAMAASNGGTPLPKQKIVKQKTKKSARPTDVSPALRKDDLGGSCDSPVNESLSSACGGTPVPKKINSAKPCNADLATQLSSRLAQLMDAAAAGRHCVVGEQRKTPPPRRCKKETSGGGGAIRPQSMDASLALPSLGSAKASDVDSQSVSKSVSSSVCSPSSCVSARQDTVDGASCSRTAMQSPSTPSSSIKSKRQKQQQKVDDTSSFDDIFLPSDETGKHESVDEFDREIEEFKRFCHNSWLLGGNRERPRVSLNLKDIFVRKKSHQGQGCVS